MGEVWEKQARCSTETHNRPGPGPGEGEEGDLPGTEGATGPSAPLRWQDNWQQAQFGPLLHATQRPQQPKYGSLLF